MKSVNYLSAAYKAGLASLFLTLGCCLQAQEFLVKNINYQSDTNGSNPAFFVSVGANIFYFKANDGVHGTELWKSDGTAEGTTLVADIAANNASADPASLVNVDGTLFFTASDVAHGRELWKSDGTAGGTVLVSDISPGSASSSPTNLVAVDNVLFFAANNGSAGVELWKSDGSVAGTVIVKDIFSGVGSSNPGNLTAFGTLLVFSANGSTNSGAGGIELWKSDGTSEGTVPVKDINPGAAGSNPQGLTVVSNILYFSALGSSTGTELWRSDGTSAGTVLVKDLLPGSASSAPQNLVNVNGTLFFAANGLGTGTNGVELWKSDGTFGGTVIVKDINVGSASSIPRNLVNLNGTLFFTANDGATGVELWKSDGTTTGTVLVLDINAGSAGSNPTNLVVIDNTLFFSANDNIAGNELWASDGTQAGTVLVKDLRSGPLSSSPQGLANINGTLIFSADDGVVGRELWKSDGTSDGTVLVYNIRASDNDSNPDNLVNLNGTLLFAANDGVAGNELWASDGTDEGTVLIKDINSGTAGSNPQNIATINGKAFFAATDGVRGSELWKSDGTSGGTVLVRDISFGSSSSNPSQFTALNGAVLFSAATTNGGTELWRTDGTGGGTFLVKDINLSASSFPTNLITVNGTLFFAANDGVNGNELWKSDGTFGGTVLVKDIAVGNINSSPRNLVDFQGTLFFFAAETSNSVGLWKSDGSAAGTVLVKTINPFAGIQPRNLTVSGTNLFFVASNVTGIALWKSDGTAAGTVAVSGANPSAPSNPHNLTDVGGTLFFSASGGTNGLGVELWKSDGTAGGTVWVKDINPGTAGSAPTNFFAINGKLYFSATDGVNGRELWQSDGTDSGTFQVGDITGDSQDSNPSRPTLVGGTLYFSAQTVLSGRELYGYVLNHAPMVINPLSDQADVYGSSFSLTIPADTFGDEDLDQTLVYSVSGLPPGISFNTDTFSGTFTAAGQYTVTVVATDNGSPLPLNATNQFVITVAKASPIVTWNAPSNIVYGTALDSQQLNASADVAGSFVYTPAGGTVLHVGTAQVLSAGFIPADTNNYSGAAATVAITVTKAPLSVKAVDTSRIYGAANPAFALAYSGLVNGDSSAVIDAAPVAATTATAASAVGSYSITLSGGTDNDYELSLVGGVLSVLPAPLTVTANNASRIYGVTNPIFSGSLSGIKNGDNITATYSCAATVSSFVGVYPIVPALVDPDGKLGNYTVTIHNGTLTIRPAQLTVHITDPASGFVQLVNSNILFAGNFTPSGFSGPYLAYWKFSRDGSADIVVPGIVSNNIVTANVAFAEAGIYAVALTVTNGGSVTATTVLDDLPAYVVIYDPAGGFVTGGGQILSPAGAYLLDPNQTGRATFGVVSKYQDGAAVPSGQTQFKVADLDFHSTAYDWLLVSGTTAQCRGSGTINGDGDYGFILTAMDGGNGADKFRIKIWEKQQGVVVYDSQPGSSDTSDPTTSLQGGNILVHHN